MTADAHTNFAYSTIVTAPSPDLSGTSIVVGTGDGANFPTVPFNATIWPWGVQPSATNAEIVRVTNISTDTLTITRGPQSDDTGGINRAVIIGDQIAATITAKTLRDAELSGWSNQVVKASDESVSSSATTQNDDELFFTAESGKQYEVEIVIIYGSSAGGGTPDLKIDLGEDATARGVFGGDPSYSTADAAASVTAFLANQTATATFGTATTDRVVKISGVYTGNGGTFRLRWAQNTSGGNATIVRAKSLIRYRKIN